MTRYTHPDLPDFISPAAFTLDGVQYPRVWWRTVDAQEIAALGFVEYVPPEPEPPTLEQRKAQMLDAIRDRRWQCETGGITVSGAPIRTDEVSQAKITGAVSLFASDETLTSIDWEAQPGAWVTIDASTMTAIGIAVGRHVQGCFTHARSLSEAVEAAEDHEALDLIDIESGWPGAADAIDAGKGGLY